VLRAISGARFKVSSENALDDGLVSNCIHSRHPIGAPLTLKK
jgi:hypothetical protein